MLNCLITSLFRVLLCGLALAAFASPAYALCTAQVNTPAGEVFQVKCPDAEGSRASRFGSSMSRVRIRWSSPSVQELVCTAPTCYPRHDTLCLGTPVPCPAEQQQQQASSPPPMPLRSLGCTERQVSLPNSNSEAAVNVVCEGFYSQGPELERDCSGALLCFLETDEACSGEVIPCPGAEAVSAAPPGSGASPPQGEGPPSDTSPPGSPPGAMPPPMRPPAPGPSPDGRITVTVTVTLSAGTRGLGPGFLGRGGGLAGLVSSVTGDE